MGKWTKESAISRLNHLIAKIDYLKKEAPESAEHKRWELGVLTILMEVFGRTSFCFQKFSALTFQKPRDAYTAALAERTSNASIERTVNQIRWEGFQTGLESARGILQAAGDQLESANLEDVFQDLTFGSESNATIKLINVAKQKLRKVTRKVPEKEKEVQDSFENILIGAGILYSREADNIEYSSKTYIPDFTFPACNLALDD